MSELDAHLGGVGLMSELAACPLTADSSTTSL
jgi:hypothetical protein